MDSSSLSKAAIEGLLVKYTNVVKGYQYRWFTLSPGRGTLEYYIPEDKKKIHPRGSIYLAGCTVSPSDEDGQTFTTTAATGESWRLKAADAKERQFWVDKLRQVAMIHETNLESKWQPAGRSTRPEVVASFAAVRDILVQAQKGQRTVSNSIEDYSATDSELLLLKATSHATVMSLEQCFAILQSIQNQRP
ncbi:Oxysterol-binding protein-related protein 11 [Halotydeus destructor]|nr:Oxysterol-binding protein-related protein 11 [Halotydeus destructor]